MQQATSEELLLRLKENSAQDPYNFNLSALNAAGSAIPPNFTAQLKKYLSGETEIDFSLLRGSKFGLLRPLAPYIQAFSRFKACCVPLVAVDDHRWAGFFLTFSIMTLEDWTLRMYNSLMYEMTMLAKSGAVMLEEFLDHKPWNWGLFTVQEKTLAQTGKIFIADCRRDVEIVKFYQELIKIWSQSVKAMNPYTLITMKEALDKFLSGEFKITGPTPLKFNTINECQTLLREGGNLQTSDFVKLILALTQKKIIREHHYENIFEFMRTGNPKLKIYVPKQNEIGMLAPFTPEKIDAKNSIPVFTADNGTTWFTLMFKRLVKGSLKELVEIARTNSPLEEVRNHDLWGLYCPSEHQMVLRGEVSFRMDEMDALLTLVTDEIKKRPRDEEGGEIEDEPAQKIPCI